MLCNTPTDNSDGASDVLIPLELRAIRHGDGLLSVSLFSSGLTSWFGWIGCIWPNTSGVLISGMSAPWPKRHRGAVVDPCRIPSHFLYAPSLVK
jgi:hypothetical protein